MPVSVLKTLYYLLFNSHYTLMKKVLSYSFLMMKLKFNLSSAKRSWPQKPTLALPRIYGSLIMKIGLTITGHPIPTRTDEDFEVRKADCVGQGTTVKGK